MLEKLLKLYAATMAGDIRSPLPHMVGPPGCGKSTFAEQLAQIAGVNLHIINVSRISPLEVEGVQMPVTEDGERMKLRLLHATWWTQIKHGDIVLLDEFLRAFPEVYNALLDILTSHQVGGYTIEKAFFIGASNSVATYDRALEDRLLHLPVDDPRNKPKVRKDMAAILIEYLGLYPKIQTSLEMHSLIENVVCPMFNLLDQFNGQGNAGQHAMGEGKSLRNLIGQAKLREVQTDELKDLIAENNRLAMADDKAQYVLLLDGKQGGPLLEKYAKQAAKLPKEKLSEIEVTNLELNLQLIEMEKIRQVKGLDDDSDVFDEPEPDPF